MRAYWLGIAGLCWCLPVPASELTLRVMARPGQNQSYFLALLRASLAQSGTPVRLQAVPDMPNSRAESLLEDGRLDIQWLIRTPARDRRFLLVAQPLTDGMIGKRIPMVSPSRVSAFAGLRTLADWQRSGKVAAIGYGWADVAIWQRNGLAVSPQRTAIADLYRLVASGQRNLDYFPRGSIEVAPEQALHAGLVPLPGVMLVYPQDFYFYVSPQRPQLQTLLQKALQLAEQRGLRQRLFQQHYGAALAALAMDKRQVIALALPAHRQAGPAD